jgi:hypothetical protein
MSCDRPYYVPRYSRDSLGLSPRALVAQAFQACPAGARGSPKGLRYGDTSESRCSLSPSLRRDRPHVKADGPSRTRSRTLALTVATA